MLGDAEHRLKFVQQSLQYESDRDTGLASMRERYADYLPDEALTLVAEEPDSHEQPHAAGAAGVAADDGGLEK